MINLLKGRGYRFTEKDTLQNREFREADQSFEVNEDLSSFEKRAYDITQVYELFLDEKSYRLLLMESIIEDTRANDIDEISFTVVEDERGYLITFTTIKQGVK
tara:strand:+ start:4472 stop:4780 length:309 start_codon:yes stop_codon:yes gene_type:complete